MEIYTEKEIESIRAEWDAYYDQLTITEWIEDMKWWNALETDLIEWNKEK